MKKIILLTIVVSIINTVGAQWQPTSLNSGGVLSLATDNTNIFAGILGEGMFLSINNGNSWDTINNGLPQNSSVISLAINDTNIFAGTSGEGMFLSTNNGSNWVAVNNGLPANSSVISLAINDTNIFAGISGHKVFLSTNNGNNWTSINNGMTFLNAFALAISGINIFAGTSGGIFLSTDNGNSWNDVSDGLTNKDIVSIAICDTSIYAGTNGSGVWKRSLSEIGIKENSVDNSEISVYPNPTDNTLFIRSSLKINEYEVYNSLGEKVYTGIYNNSHGINVKSFSQGIYLLRTCEKIN